MGVTEFLREREYSCYKSPKYRCYKEHLNNWLDSLGAAPSVNQPCEFSGEPKATFLVEFSPDGTRVASSHGDHTVRVTEVATGKCTHILTGHPRTPWCLAFHPSHNDILASGCLGGHVRIWDLRGGGSEMFKTETLSLIASLTFHPVDNILVFSTRNKMYIWDWTESKPTITCETTVGSVRWVKFDCYGHSLYTGICNGQNTDRVSIMERLESGPRHASSSGSSSSGSERPVMNAYINQRRQNQRNYIRILELGLHGPNVQQAEEDPERPQSPVHQDRLRQAFHYARYMTNNREPDDDAEQPDPLPAAMEGGGEADRMRYRFGRSQRSLSNQGRRTIRLVANSPPPQPARSRDHDEEHIMYLIETAENRRHQRAREISARLDTLQRPPAERRETILFRPPLPGDTVYLVCRARGGGGAGQSTPSSSTSVSTASSQTPASVPSPPPQNSSQPLAESIDREHSSQPSVRHVRMISPLSIDTRLELEVPVSSAHSSVGASSASVPFPHVPSGRPHTASDHARSRSPERSVQSSSLQFRGASTSSAQTPGLVLPQPVHPTSSFAPAGGLASSVANMNSCSALSAQSLRLSSASSSSSSAFQSVCPPSSDSNSGEEVLGRSGAERLHLPVDNSTAISPSTHSVSGNNEHAIVSSHPPPGSMEASAAGGNVCVTESCSMPSSSHQSPPPFVPSSIDHGSSGASSSGARSCNMCSSSSAVGSDPLQSASQYVPLEASSSVEAKPVSSLATAASDSHLRTTNGREAERVEADRRDADRIHADRIHAESVLRSYLLRRAPPRPPSRRSGSTSLASGQPFDWTDFQRGSLSCMYLARFQRVFPDRPEFKTEINEIRLLRQTSAYICDLFSRDHIMCPICFTPLLRPRGEDPSWIADFLTRGKLRRSMPRLLPFNSSARPEPASANVHIMWNDRQEGTLDASSQTNRNSRESHHVDQSTDTTDSAHALPGAPEESCGPSTSQPGQSRACHTLPEGESSIHDTLEVIRGKDRVQETITYWELARLLINRVDVTVLDNHPPQTPGVPEESSGPSTSQSESTGSSLPTVVIMRGTDGVREAISCREFARRVANREDIIVMGSFRHCDHQTRPAPPCRTTTARDSARNQQPANPPPPVPPPPSSSTASSSSSSSTPATSQQSSSFPPVPRIFVQRPSSEDQPQGGSQETAGANAGGAQPLEESLQRDTLHPHYADSVMNHPQLDNAQGYQFSLNRAIAGVFMSAGEQAVANNIVPGTYRIQRWDMQGEKIPDLTQTNMNIVVQNCKIHNDASVALSKDSSLLAAFVSIHRGFPDENVLSVFSLMKESFGQCLYTKSFGPNAISVSISPSCQYLLVGLASKRMFFFHVDQQLVGQIYKMVKKKAGEDSMKHTTDVFHPVQRAQAPAPRLMSPVSVNSARWLPEVGQGIVYGTNHGDLHFFRSGRTKAEVEEEESRPRKISMSTQAGHSFILRTAATQTAERETAH